MVQSVVRALDLVERVVLSRRAGPTIRLALLILIMIGLPLGLLIGLVHTDLTAVAAGISPLALLTLLAIGRRQSRRSG